uniref:Mitochondrial import inner membrane translocase subunit Tim21 n=1 Tax=Ananas comosus var. bracteatus TaxID=296719 RepID=A0A6V7PEF1_ANACO|nr:unnamed protein product [Ananas comosus var. bracteatus]
MIQPAVVKLSSLLTFQKFSYRGKPKVIPSKLKNPVEFSNFAFRSKPIAISHHGRHQLFPSLVRTCAANYSTNRSNQAPREERKDISTVDDPFDAPTYNIPEKPVTFAEGASYSVVILAGLGIAALAAYAVFKELIFEPKELLYILLINSHLYAGKLLYSWTPWCWKGFEIKSPTQAQLMLESYVPA